jgi:hypothetical protein
MSATFTAFDWLAQSTRMVFIGINRHDGERGSMANTPCDGSRIADRGARRANRAPSIPTRAGSTSLSRIGRGMTPKDMASLGAKDISRWMIRKGVLWVIELTLRAGLQP